MKLNWRDASKELPDGICIDCVVIARSFSTSGEVITGTYNSYYSKSLSKWGCVDNCHVVAWIYTHELLPSSNLLKQPEDE